MLSLRPCARALSSCGKQGPLFIAVRGPLTIAAPPVAAHRLQTRRLSSCGSRAQPLRGTRDLPRPGLEPASPAPAGRLSTTALPGKPKTLIDITNGTKTDPQETDYQDGFLRLVTLTKDIEITVAFMLDDHRLTLIICFVGPLKAVLKSILVSIRLKLKNILGSLYKIKCKHFEMGSGCWACCHYYIRIHPFSHCLYHRPGYSFHQGTKKCIVKRSTNII